MTTLAGRHQRILSIPMETPVFDRVLTTMRDKLHRRM